MCNSNDTPEEMKKISFPPPQVFRTDRADGRFITSAGFIHEYYKHLKPKLAFDPEMSRNEFLDWRKKVRAKLFELMCFPEFDEKQPKPRLIWSEPRDGYTIQRWEIYPEPYSVVPFLMLIPDGATASNPAPGVLCFPGSFSSKESLCGELELNGEPCSHRWAAYNKMALEFIRAGMVSVAVENPATNELADPICMDSYEFSVHTMWIGRCYESVSAYQKYCILQWLKTQPIVDATRIGVSGHSLGAKPALILGVLDPDVRAVVWNDSVGSWRQRAVVRNLERIGTFQYVPGLLQYFDYPDLMAALAPTAFCISEGGRLEFRDMIQKAFDIAGEPDNFAFYFYPALADPANRHYDYAPMREGIGIEEFLLYANCDAKNHRFEGYCVVPFMTRILKPNRQNE